MFVRFPDLECWPQLTEDLHNMDKVPYTYYDGSTYIVKVNTGFTSEVIVFVSFSDFHTCWPQMIFYLISK